MYLLRTTQIEKFRRYLDEASFYDTEQSVIDSLTGEFHGNEYTWIGTAFHLISEKGKEVVKKIGDKYLVVADEKEVFFSREQVIAALEYRHNLPGAFAEIKTGKDYSTKYFDVHIGGTMDKIWGNQIRDTKTKYSPMKPKDYMDSYQWRFYLDYMGLDQFFFDVFEFVGYKKGSLDVSGLRIKVHEPIECLRYDGMEQDCQNLLEKFCEFIHDRGLMKYLKQKEDYYK